MKDLFRDLVTPLETLMFKFQNTEKESTHNTAYKLHSKLSSY